DARPVLLALALAIPGLAAGDGWASLPGAKDFVSVLRYEDSGGRVDVAPFEMMVHPVTNAQFLAFVTRNPAWRRGEVATVFAEPRYLSHWSGPLSLGERALPQQPLTQVSWFAASAYCEAEGG